MKVFLSSTYLDLIEHRKAAHCTAGAKARAQFMEVLQNSVTARRASMC